jgi:enterochelin esterase family protein
MERTQGTTDETLTFRMPDPEHRLRGVRLQQDVRLPGDLLGFVRAGDEWVLTVPRPDVDRMEYSFEIQFEGGGSEWICDPGNPLRVGGAFGDKSVLEFPGYRAPAWLASDRAPGDETTLEIESAGLAATVSATLWSPAGLDAAEPAPLLVVHDGPEYDLLGGFTHYVGVAIATGALPPVRVALLGPGDRNAWYSAAADYARALTGEVLPALDARAPASLRIGIGVSLGAVAMLHAHRGDPRGFDGLLLQSGSFFTPALDPQESGFPGFAAVTGFVGGLHAARTDPKPVPTVITCGTTEENLANNEAMAATLGRLGYPIEFVRVRDSHNYTAWRDTLDPHLTALITEVVCARAA